MSWLEEKSQGTLDAYAMEQGIVEILERQIGQFDVMPDAQEKIQQHLELTKTQADRVRACVERLEDDVSHVKSGVANILGAVQGMSTVMAKDRMVKDAMAIVTAAREMGIEDIASICETIITEEQDMADWLEMQLPMVVRQHLLGEVHT